MYAITQKGAQCDHLSGGPVNTALTDMLGAPCHLWGDLGVSIEAFWQILMSPGDGLHCVRLDLGLVQATVLDRVVWHTAVGLRRRGGFANLLEHCLQTRAELCHHSLGVLGSDIATTDEALGVELAGRALFSDEAVHVRLCEARIVTLVMAAPAIAHHVNDDIAMEGLAILVGDTSRVDHRCRVISVDVEDRCANSLSDIGAVG